MWMIPSAAFSQDSGEVKPSAETSVADVQQETSTTSFTTAPSGRIDAEHFRALYQDENYEKIISLCNSGQAAMETDEYVDRLLYYCGQSRFKIYEKNNDQQALNAAINDLERSTYLYYLPSTAFALGKARMASVEYISDASKSKAVQRQALGEMWDAMVKRHAQEGYPTAVLSDTLLSWSISYYDSLIDRIIKEDEAAVRWLTARVRMLTDRYSRINPEMGENQTRQVNLRTISGWIRELYEATYFDNRSPVGMLKFLGDRNMENYDQTAQTEKYFLQALGFYDKGLARARSLKGKAVLKEKISYLTSLFNSQDKEKKILYYKVGFFHANNALELLNRLAAGKSREAASSYWFEPLGDELLDSLKINYGRNLSGLLYFLWEKGDYQSVVTLRSAFDVDFNWTTKLDDLLRIADAASKLARNEFRGTGHNRDIITFESYKEMCLTSASQAFNYALKASYEGGLDQSSFCSTLETYAAFLSGFGEIAEASHLTGVYGPRCSGNASR